MTATMNANLKDFNIPSEKNQNVNSVVFLFW
jgi:hypothetical protein